MTTLVPETSIAEIAPDTFLIPNLAHAGPDAWLAVNSVVIRGREPIVVDTGAPIHRQRWVEQVFSVVDPKDVKWIFLSHDDGDHTGGLHDMLDACPNATLVANFFSTERLALEREMPLERMIWREPGETFDAGDRTFRLVLPPIFDGPATRGLFDEKTGFMWAVDSFAALLPGAVHYVEDVPTDLYDQSFREVNSLVSPWAQWLDPVRYNAHVDTVEGLKPSIIASAHGPVLRGSAIHDAFDRVRELAGKPRWLPPGQSMLDELMASVATV